MSVEGLLAAPQWLARYSLESRWPQASFWARRGVGREPIAQRLGHRDSVFGASSAARRFAGEHADTAMVGSMGR